MVNFDVRYSTSKHVGEYRNRTIDIDIQRANQNCIAAQGVRRLSSSSTKPLAIVINNNWGTFADGKTKSSSGFAQNLTGFAP